jgi:hypothetical protein
MQSFCKEKETETSRMEKRSQTAHCAICGALTNLFDKVEEQFVCSVECDDLLCDWMAKAREPWGEQHKR